MSMDFIIVLRNMQKNTQPPFRESIVHLQSNQVLTSLGCVSIMQPQGTTNQLVWQVWWNTFKNLRLCQPNAYSHLISSPLLSKWPSSNWTHWHFIIKHNPCLVCTFVGTLITLKHSLRNSVPLSNTQTRNAHPLTSCDIFIKNHV